MSDKKAYGDFQTPLSLAQEVCALLKRKGIDPTTIIEPTCGEGNFLAAAIDVFSSAQAVIGVDINPEYIEKTREKVRQANLNLRLTVGDFFVIDWAKVLAEKAKPVLLIGNPPWVTNTELGVIGSGNLPAKKNFKALNGFEALTGKSNFDISEWMLIHLFERLKGGENHIAMLCKTSVARKVLGHAWQNSIHISEAEMYLIDTKKYFDASVDACLLYCGFSSNKEQDKICRVYADLKGKELTTFGYRDGQLVANIANYERYGYLQGGTPCRWRSGIKHDCSKVMELVSVGNHFENKFGKKLDLELDYLYPLLKSSDLVNGGIAHPRKWLLVTQKYIGEETGRIEQTAPKTWQYLIEHEEWFSKRKSRIYNNRPRFSIFGVGEYSFSKWKVAISGLYKTLEFKLVGSYADKPIVLDDTCYFLPCDTLDDAKTFHELLCSDAARSFLEAFIFWDDKRPIKVDVLKRLDLIALAKEQNLYEHISEGNQVYDIQRKMF